MINDKWLPHLQNEMMVGARNNNLCSYLIALEGWRRGLTLTWHSKKVKRQGIHAPGRMFSLSDGEKEHFFYKAKGDKVSGKAIRIGSHKELTKEWLSKANISVPEGRNFLEKDTDDTIIEYCNNIGYPVVLKPTKGFQGIGVIANIENEMALREAINYVRYELNMLDVIIERYITGKEYRFFVIEDEVKAVLNRTPANVIGDGIHDINELIKIKNKERKKNPRLFNCLIKIDYEMERLIDKGHFTLDYIPKKGEQVFLREKSNISTGGDSEDVTDTMPDDVKQVAIDTLKALPELPHGGVDIIVDLNKVTDRAVVLEINAIPQIGSLVFPMKGQARDIPSALIDYYFPDTKNKLDFNSNVYFGYRETLAPLMTKTASEVIVTPVPKPETYKRKYTLKGKFTAKSYQRWIRRKALENDLYGYIKRINKNKMDVVVAGDQSNVEEFKHMFEQGPKSAAITEVVYENWNKSIKVGFYILKDAKIKKQSKKIVKPQKLTFKQKVKRKIKRIIKRK